MSGFAHYGFAVIAWTWSPRHLCSTQMHEGGLQNCEKLVLYLKRSRQPEIWTTISESKLKHSRQIVISIHVNWHEWSPGFEVWGTAISRNCSISFIHIEPIFCTSRCQSHLHLMACPALLMSSVWGTWSLKEWILRLKIIAHQLDCLVRIKGTLDILPTSWGGVLSTLKNTVSWDWKCC